MIKDNLALIGTLEITLNNKVVQKTNNLVVNVGKAWVAGMMQGTGSVMSHMALGTGTSGSADAGDTGLGGAGTAELLNSRQAFSTATSYDANARTITYINTWVAENAAGAPTGSGTGAITEAGIFDATSGGTMLARTIFSSGVVNKGADDEMTITWTITIS